MSRMTRTVPPTLEAALSPVREMDGVELSDPWSWNDDAGYWTLCCTLRPRALDPDGSIPEETVWYVVASNSYPEGSIRFCPAKDGGIEETYPHMLFNMEGREDVPWRSCWICLDTRVRALGRFGGNDEPSGYRNRLSWRFERAMHWLELASRGELMRDGEPFELPVLPVKKTATVVFSERPDHLDIWEDAPRCGRVCLATLRTRPDVLVVKDFKAPSGESLLSPQWGRHLKQKDVSEIPAVWIRLDEVPVMTPWQAPQTWGELREVCQSQGVNIDRHLRRTLRTVECGRPIVLLFGFPLPAEVGRPPHQQHWYAAALPAMQERYDRDGFRPKSSWEGYKTFELRDHKPISWCQSENWSRNEISTRGRLASAVTSQHVGLLGAGALGSTVGELLVRGSLQRVTVVDGQHFEAGNLVRHTLSLDALKKPKAERLAERLNTVSPHADVDYFNAPFPPDGEDAVAQLQSADIILDCTGEDSVLREMQIFDWSTPKYFISLSLGMRGHRLFCFLAEGMRFPYETFEQEIAPWLTVERCEFSGQDLQWEGTGCYHPVFEARQDDVALLASLGVKWIEKRLRDFSGSGKNNSELVVFEQHEQDGIPEVRRAELPAVHHA